MDVYEKFILSVNDIRSDLEQSLIEANPDFVLETMLARIQWFIMCCVALRMMEDRKASSISLSDIKELTRSSQSLWQNVLNAIANAHEEKGIAIFAQGQSLFAGVNLPATNQVLAKFIKSLYTIEGWRVDFSEFEGDTLGDLYKQYIKYLEFRLEKGIPQ